MLTNPVFRKVSATALVLSAILALLSLTYFVYTIVRTQPSVFDTNVALNYELGDTQVRDNTYTYYTGNNFIQLSLPDMTKRKMTSYNLLTNISSIYWLNNGAVFNFTAIPQGEKLSSMFNRQIKQLEDINESLDAIEVDPQNMYWYLNYSTGNIEYLTYTTNSFDIKVGSSGEYVYFSDTLTSPEGNIQLGSLSSDGKISRGLLELPSGRATRIIKQENNILTVLQENTSTGRIDLLSFDTKKQTSNVVVSDVFNTAQGSVYDDILISDSSLIFSEYNNDKHVNQIYSINLSTKERDNIHNAPESSIVEFTNIHTITITDLGEDAMKVSYMTPTGSPIGQPVVTNRVQSFAAIIPYSTGPLQINRPYIKVESSSYKNIPSIQAKAIEKGFNSPNSSLERNIYSDVNDVNTYNLLLSQGSLHKEYDRVLTHAKQEGISDTDITIIPLLGNKAVYDLN